MKIWTNTKFEGYWPVGTAAVVIAETRGDATKYLNMLLSQMDLSDAKSEDMEEVPFKDGMIKILCDGNY
jgi:hypothetical protein